MNKGKSFNKSIPRKDHTINKKKKSFHSIVENNKIFILVYLSMLYLYIMNLYHEKCSMIQFLNNIRIYVCIVEKNYTHVYVCVCIWHKIPMIYKN